MKRIALLLMVFVVLGSQVTAVFADEWKSVEYIEEKASVSFLIPTSWERKPFHSDKEMSDAKWGSIDKSDISFVMLALMPLPFEMLLGTEFDGQGRITKDSLMAIVAAASEDTMSLDLTNHSGKWYATTSGSMELMGNEVRVGFALTAQRGHMIAISLWTMVDGTKTPPDTFERILESLEVTAT